MKIIFKNLWNRRGKYAWLFIELIIVTAIAWFIIDSAAVGISDSRLPLGYDVDRLVIVKAETLPENSRSYVAGLSKEDVAANFDTFMDKIRRYDGVERISPQYSSYILNDHSMSINHYSAGVPADTTVGYIFEVHPLFGTEIFETYGIEAAPGSPDARELSALTPSPNDVIITESLGRMYWPDEPATGKHFIHTSNGDTTYINIVGVVRDVRYQSFLRTAHLVFNTSMGVIGAEPKWKMDAYDVVVRLRPGVEPAEFAPRFAQWAASNMTTGNFYVRSVLPYRDIIERVEYDRGITAGRNTNIALTAFFLINLVLGVVGSFYMQTRRRIAEMGVHRSFGATRADIVRMLMGEAIVLGTAAFIIGDFVMLQVLMKYGMSNGYRMNSQFSTIDNWVSDFWVHFGIISAVVYACIIGCVIIGTIAPAIRASRISPVTALRDE